MTPDTAPRTADVLAATAKLTKAQRDALTGRIVHIAKRDQFVSRGLLTSDGGRNWTPLGLLVRNHLLNQDQPS